MIAGLLWKAVRETRMTVLLFGVGMMIVTALLTRLLPQLQGAITQLAANVPLVRALIAASLGSSTEVELTTRMLLGLLWAHPVVMTIVWACDISLCTRFPVGEIDRGTIDVLLGWPVSRLAVFLTETVIWLLAGIVVCGLGLAGWLIGGATLGVYGLPRAGEVALVIANLYLVYLAVGGFAFLVSSLSDRRGTAMALIFAVVLASYLVNVLAPFWPPAASLRFLSVLEYYQPGRVLVAGAIPPLHAVVLAGFAMVTWAAAAVITTRRSITTV